MANVKITDLTAYTDPLNTDVLPIVDVTNNVTKKVSIANLAKNVSLGTAALPGVAFDGDPNTGIYSPGADQLAISTGGTGRIIVDASGNVNIDSNTLYVDAVNNRVGIGTTGPGTLLQVGSGSDSNGVISLFNSWSSSETGKLIFKSNNNFNASLGIAAIYANEPGTINQNRGNLIFATGQDAAPTEKLRIDSTGVTTITSNASVAPLIIKISTSEVARIDSSGRLLVGTSSDSGGALLQVNGDRIRVGTAKTPATSGATGTAGEICWDASYIYVCTATNTWKRTAIATW